MPPLMRRITAAGATLAAILAFVPAASAPAAADVTPAPLRILTIGDSITAAGAWQAELDRLLTVAGVPHTIVNVGVGATDCYYWTSRIGGLLAQHQPDLVTVQCGTNDDVNATIYGEPKTSWSFRVIVETIRTYRPSNPIRILPALIGYSDPLMSPQWLLDSEPVTNDRLWSNMQLYMPPRTSPSWFAGISDFQKLPATATYLDGDTCNPATATCAVHPTDKGYRAMGRIVYDSARSGMGWPPAIDPPLCDMYGHRRGYPRPSYTPCQG